MRVHLIKRQTIEAYAKNHNAEIPFAAWLSKLKKANWNKPTDIKATFNSADLLGRNCERVVFNIGGNNYRIICKYYFGKKQIHLYVCWVGSHAEYDILNDKNEQYTVKLK